MVAVGHKCHKVKATATDKPSNFRLQVISQNEHEDCHASCSDWRFEPYLLEEDNFALLNTSKDCLCDLRD